jgi:uncharacterized protein (UPF0335 family)
MPTTPSRAARWIKSGKATPFWKRGVFCVRLNVEPSDRKTQDVVVGVDPGSKMEGFTVKSSVHTYLNLQAKAVTWVKDAMKSRRWMRINRRGRNTPCRQPRPNRLQNRKFLAPSTKARWQWKLRILNWLRKMYPVTCAAVEDVKAVTKKGAKKIWNRRFSQLEYGKNWFYEQIRAMFRLETRRGFDTKNLRDAVGLKKSRSKMAFRFDAHCVDSWVLANEQTGGHVLPDNTEMLLISPLRFHRRQLHFLEPASGGIRPRYGGTRSLGFKRGSLVKHKKYGLTYVGGFRDVKGCPGTRLSLHDPHNSQRVCRAAKPVDCKFLTFNSWTTS